MSELLPAPPLVGSKKRRVLRFRNTEEKRRIVEETFAPGASVSIVARRHDVNANQVFKWRRQYHRGELGGALKAVEGFVPVGVIGHDGLLATEQEKPDSVPSAALAALPVQAGARGIITLSLRGGEQLRMEGDINLPMLRCTLKTVLGQL